VNNFSFCKFIFLEIIFDSIVLALKKIIFNRATLASAASY